MELCNNIYMCSFADDEYNSLECSFNDERICGWSSAYAKKRHPATSNNIITDWTRTRMGIGGELQNLFNMILYISLI